MKFPAENMRCIPAEYEANMNYHQDKISYAVVMMVVTVWFLLHPVLCSG